MNTLCNASRSLKFPHMGVQLLITLILSVFLFSKVEAHIAVANNPSAFTGSIDQAYINAANVSNITFTYSGAVVGGRYDVSVQSSGGGTASSGGIAVTSASQTITVFCSACVYDGTVTISYTFKDSGGNPIGMFTDTRIKDTVLPSFDVLPTSSNITDTSFDLNVDMNEAGKAYYVIVADGATAPTVDDVMAGNSNGGGTPVTSGNASVTTGGFTHTLNITGLSDATSYDVYAIVEDVAGNLINAVSKIDVVTTADATNPVFTSATTANFAENGTGTAYTVTATDANAVTYSFGVGNDEGLFNIVSGTGVVTFKNAPDFETPTDGGANNTYAINVIASDGINTINQDVTITVTDVDDTAPVFTSAITANFAENGTGTVYTVVATDANTITYSLSTTKDEALFNIVGASGVVTFKNVPDFETPTDGGANNTYVINVIASDGVNAADQDVTITVTNVNEDPSFTSTAVTTVNDNETYSYKIATSDEDNDAVTVSATTKPDWLTLELVENEVSTFAGSGDYASVDGTGNSASFYMPDGITLDALGNIYVSDFGTSKIRKVTPDGVVTTLAGSGELGNTNGNGANASFKYPRGLAVDAAGNVYVADRDNNVIRKVTPSGDVTTYAGSGTWGSTNGPKGSASFSGPNDVVLDASGNLYVTDGSNNLIRKIDTDGNVSTFASVGSPFGIAIDAAGYLYVTERDNDLVRKIAPNGDVTTLAGTGTQGSADGFGTSASFNYPSGIALDAAGNVYVADNGNNKIRKIAPDGEVTTIAFIYQAAGVVVDASGSLYVSTFDNKMENISSYYLLSGSAEGHAGKHDVTLSASDGNGATATQSFVIDVSRALTPDADNILYVNKGVSGGDNRGGSWANAVTELADALVWAKENYDNIWATTPLKIYVAKGTYKPLYSPEDGVDFGTDQGRDNSFLMINNVQLYGGFDPANAIDDLGDARILPNSSDTGTLLSGDVNDDDGVDFSNNTDNLVRVMVSSGDLGKALLNGFTIRGANGENNSTITVNGNPIYQCSGAGIYNSISSPVYENILLEGNYNTESGGGMFSYQSSPTLRNIIFKNNKANHGGGMANQDNSSPTLINTVFINNTAIVHGGAIYNVTNSFPTFVNSTVANNNDTDGGLYNEDTSSPNLYNSIIWGGTFGNYQAENSIIEGSTDNTNGNIDATSITIHDIFQDPSNGDYSPKDNSPAVNVGSNTLYTDAGGNLANDVDLAGNPRLFDGIPTTGIIDMGAYEYLDNINPVFNSVITANFEENSIESAYTVTATDVNPIIFSLGTGNDEDLFDIVDSTGVVTFKLSPDFENPLDGNADNAYVINVIASDGVNSADQDVTITVTDVKGILQSITFDPLIQKSANDANFDLSATSSSALAVSYTSSDESVATITGSTVTIVGGGTTTITASQAGDSDYAAATSVQQVLTVNKIGQTISFGALSEVGFDAADFDLSATASSGLAVLYTSSDETVATVTGNTVTIVGGGTTTITASQAGNSDYTAATSVQQRLTVNKIGQTISFGALTEVAVDAADFDLSATASSELAVTYSSSDESVATITGSTVTIVGSGTTTIIASQAGNSDYTAATSVQQVLTVIKLDQTITFDPIDDQFFEVGSLQLNATASSGLNVSYEIVSGPATIEDGEITFTNIGSVTVRASQVGDNIHLEATPIERSFEVITVTGVEVKVSPSIRFYPNPMTNSMYFDAGNEKVLRIDIRDLTGKLVITKENPIGEIDVTYLNPGNYLVQVITPNEVITQQLLKK